MGNGGYSTLERAVTTARVAALSAVESRVPFWPAASIDWLQRRRLRSIVRHAYDSVPFYRRAMDERGLRPRDFRTVEDLQRLPLIDSLTVRLNADQFISRAVRPAERQAFDTSGTVSGVHLRVYWDHSALMQLLTYGQRDLSVLRRLLQRSWGQDQLFILPPFSAAIELRHFWDARTIAPRGLARRHYLTHDAPFDVAVERLNAVRPHLVMSYGSYAEQFFRMLADRKVDVALPRVWSYGGDTLGSAARAWIESTYGCLVVSAYGSVENGRLGWECERRRGYHLNVDYCAVRLVDADGRSVPPGQLGELVVSNLHNRAMVLLNMRQNDLGSMGPRPCPCGRTLPLLGSFDGRTSELVQLADGRALPERVIVTSLYSELVKGALVSQIVHPRPGEIRWHIVAAPGTDLERFRAGVLSRSHEVLGQDMTVAVDFVDHIARATRGKLRRVVPQTDTNSEAPPGVC